MAEMKTEKKSVFEYLSKNKFVIPIYQRPYTWGIDQCNQLWNDIIEFFQDSQEDDEYFLGSVVMYQQNKKQNIIDGQQRTTTLTLLIRALYNKISEDKSEEIKNLATMLTSCLWDIDDISGKANYSQPHIRSDVAGDEEQKKLEEILSNSYLTPSFKDLEKSIKKANSNYEKNYLFFTQKSNEFAMQDPLRWNKLCVKILKSCILLPIECDGQDEDSKLENALRIFNTLNNRGIPLSDSDIFKGEIFKSYKDLNERTKFALKWREIEDEIKDSFIKNEGMDFVFRNYMHIIRARNKIKKNEIGLRPFFMKENKEWLSDKKCIKEIEELSNFLVGAYDEEYSLRSNQLYEVLFCLPNDYWRFLDSAYYMYCRDKNKDYFETQSHEKFLNKVVANILVKLIHKPTVAEIRPIIYSAYASLYEKDELDFSSNAKQILDNEVLFKEQFFQADKLIPSLLTLYMYEKYPNQEILEDKIEIEHIFPKTTQWRASYTGWDKQEAKPLIESIGNKIWLEKKYNIQAGNKHFDDKKEEYKKSKFEEAKELGRSLKNDWLKKDIEERNEKIYEKLKKFFEENI